MSPDTGPLRSVVSGPDVDPATGEVAGDSFGAQARQAFRNLQAVLRAGGSRLDPVASTTFLVADLGDFAELNELYAEHFPAEPPARMSCRCRCRAGCRISVGCVAVVEG